MGKVIFDAFDPVLREIVIGTHVHRPTFSFKSAQEVSALTGVDLSVVKVILRRYYNGKLAKKAVK